MLAFLALPLIKPFVKKLQPLDGLFWLPVIALGIMAGLFPAYGFRPECLPMLVAVLLINVCNFIFRPGASFRSQPPLLTILLLVFLTAAAIPMYAFSPKPHAETTGEAEPFRTRRIESSRGEGSDGEYILRIYGTIQTNALPAVKPLIFLVPPDMGAAVSVDLVCRELAKKGFAVVTYSRKDYDIPHADENGQRRSASPFVLLQRWRIFRKAADLYTVNDQGKSLEAERRSDIEFLLPRLHAFLGFAGHTDLPPLLLAGYGAGGSALAYLAGEAGFASRYGQALGVVAIESRLWSSYLSQDRHAPEIPPSAGRIRYQWSLFTSRLRNMGSQRVTRTGPLPGAGLPVLYLICGRALDTKRQKPYQAVFDTVHSGSGAAALAAIRSAGPLDYQDIPFTHPLYSFFLPGLKKIPKSENPTGDTAGIIGNFAVYLLERTRQTEVITPPRQTITGDLYTESRGLPGFRL